MISTHLPEDQAELFLRVGETIVVLEDFSDGWMAGEISVFNKLSNILSFQAWRRAPTVWAFSQHDVSSNCKFEIEMLL